MSPLPSQVPALLPVDRPLCPRCSGEIIVCFKHDAPDCASCKIPSQVSSLAADWHICQACRAGRGVPMACAQCSLPSRCAELGACARERLKQEALTKLLTFLEYLVGQTSFEDYMLDRKEFYQLIAQHLGIELLEMGEPLVGDSSNEV